MGNDTSALFRAETTKRVGQPGFRQAATYVD
jgi:hypothetical protein